MHDTESDRAGLTLTRRRLLGGLVVGGAAALGRAARGSAATEWEQAVAAAKKEGKVAVNTFTGQGFARVFKLFSQAHPDIKLDHTNLEPVDFVPRVTTERRAGLYTWDVCTMPMSTALQVLKPAGVWDPVRPAIITPEARNDASWRGGFEAGFLDRDRRLAYAFTLVRAVGVFVNVDRVKDGELTSVKDLLASKWKGKIAISDPRVIGSSFWPLTVARLKLGDAFMKQLLVDQEPVLSRDRNQLTEFMVRGRYPIAIGLNALALQDFQVHGVGKNVRTLLLPSWTIRRPAAPCGCSTGRRIRTRRRCSSTGSSRRRPRRPGRGSCRRTAASSAWSPAIRTPSFRRDSICCRSIRKSCCRSSSRPRRSRSG